MRKESGMGDYGERNREAEMQEAERPRRRLYEIYDREYEEHGKSFLYEVRLPPKAILALQLTLA